MKSRPIFVLFGGTFNPVHEGHVSLVRGLAAQPGVAEVVVMPAGRNPFKSDEHLLPSDLRFNMVCAALAGLERVRVSNLELERAGPSYSIETLKILIAEQPGDWRMAMGMDVLEQFATWRSAEEILQLAGLWVVRRGREGYQSPPPSFPDPEVLRQALPGRWRGLAQAEGNRVVDGQGRELVRVLELDLPAVASSTILEGRDLAAVPEEARRMLAEFWGRETLAPQPVSGAAHRRTRKPGRTG